MSDGGWGSDHETEAKPRFVPQRTEWHNQTRGRGGRGRGGRGGRGGGGGNWRDRGATSSTFGGNDSQDNSWNNSRESNEWSDKRNDRQQGYRDRRSYDDVVTIEVPSNSVGRIIGRGGSKIRELECNSGAHIKIIKNDSGEYFTVTKIELSGSDDCVGKVKEMIMELTVDQRSGQTSRGYQQAEQQPNNRKDEDMTQINWAEVSRRCEEEAEIFWAKLPKIVKHFYKEAPEVANMPPSEAERIRSENNNTTVSYVFDDKEHEFPIPNPVETFEQCFRHYPEILENLLNMDFERPSPIQAQAWPVLLSGQDLIGIAQTGTGKTLAFLLPALIHIEGQTTPRSERQGPTVLILAPTRELAQQINREVHKYNYKDIKAVCIYGGGSRRDQIDICTKGVEIVIATPGRLSDLSVNGHIDLKSVSYLVLDEADRMLDLGFEPQIRKILIDIRPNRQTVMTSATWPPGVRRLAQSYTQDPIQVCVGSLDLAAVHSVTQTIAILSNNDDEEKYEMLLEFIRNMEEDVKAIVFCGKKARVDHLASELALAGINCQTIHGSLEQADREQALEDISDGSVKLLIATDVASRGIDISDITHVINYDFPRNVEEYVHRVGRTGRAGKTGEAISFITRADWAQAKELINILEEANQNVPQELYDMSKRYDAFKERKGQEREAGRRPGGGRGRGGGRRF